MSSKGSSDRRQFMKLCAGAAATVASYPEALMGSVKHGEFFGRVQLEDADNQPLKASNLVAEQSYIFFYPFISTPCFLIRLPQPVKESIRLETVLGEAYEWTGGVGPDHQVVAFSAICAHKMSHPSTQVSFINYRADEVQFAGKDRKFHRQSGVILCCSEGSVYDPARGAKVLGGPAPNPLASIILEYDPDTDMLHAVGVAGESMFDPYFKYFSDRLRLEFKTDQVREPVRRTAQVVPLEDYCQRQIMC